MNANNQRVVVRRKKVHGGEYHGGSWKIAYADYITSMMSFFLVMWLISIVPVESLKGIAEYFRMPLRVALMGGPSSSVESNPIQGGGADPLRDDGEVRRAQGSRLQAQPTPSEQRERRRLERLRQRIDEMIEKSPSLLQLQKQLLMDITTEGLRIQIIDSQNRPMFSSGSPQVQSYMRDLLRSLAPLLNSLPNKVSIAGHTDATRFAGGEAGYSNWELSADRANASRQELMAGGREESKIIRIQGLASSMSLVKDNPYAAINRRISLVVLNEETEKRIQSENATAADVTESSLKNLEQAIPGAAPPSAAPAPPSTSAPAR
jgi:chemotaxis protein MotB